MNKDQESKVAYLKDHVSYERWMLREAFSAMHSVPAGVQWNMVFESFGVHARNLYDFLRHEGKKANTYRADDHVPGRPKPAADLEFNELDAFLFHMSVNRADREKLSLGRLQNLGNWIDREWASWVDSLDKPYKELVDRWPVCGTIVYLNGATEATACTYPTSVSTSFGR